MSDQPSGFVILHYGSMNPEDMAKAAELIGDSAVLGTGAARMAGAAFAFGAPELLEDLEKRLAAGTREEIKGRYADLSAQASEWLATGKRGLSSEAMFSHLLGVQLWDCERNRTAYPHDPDDMRRCRLLIEAVPEVERRFKQMADLSPKWAALVAAWDEICEMMDAESPEWSQGRGSAPGTYAKMKRVLATG